MPTERAPDLGLFLDILHTLEEIQAPYMIIGAFAHPMLSQSLTQFLRWAE